MDRKFLHLFYIKLVTCHVKWGHKIYALSLTIDPIHHFYSSHHKKRMSLHFEWFFFPSRWNMQPTANAVASRRPKSKNLEIVQAMFTLRYLHPTFTFRILYHSKCYLLTNLILIVIEPCVAYNKRGSLMAR